MLTTDQDKELARHICLEALVNRHPAALPIAHLRRKVQPEVGHEVTEQDLASILSYLEDKSLVRHHYDELGSTTYYQATAEGINLVERGKA